MKIGVPKEIKNNENRVSITPANVYGLSQAGHQVLVEKGAGLGASIPDKEYQSAGAQILDSAQEVWKQADLVVKVKEPLPEEYPYLREGLILFTYLHLAGNKELTEKLLETGVIAIGYETVAFDGQLPLLSPMSEVAGRISIQVAAHFLEKPNGGKGVLMGGVPGTDRGKVVIIGGGTVGLNAAKMAHGLGAEVVILDTNIRRLAEIDEIFSGTITTLASNSYNIAKEIRHADVVIGSVLIPGRRAPVLVTEAMVKSMQAGSVIIDVAVDQGGNFETSSHTTTLEDPTYVVHDVIHYAVANMPGAVPNTATFALTNATGPYISLLANQGIHEALKDPRFLTGLNTYKGQLTNLDVAESLDLAYTPYGD